VNDVGEPCAGEPLARFDAAAGGNPGQSASPCGPGSLPPTLQGSGDGSHAPRVADSAQIVDLEHFAGDVVDAAVAAARKVPVVHSGGTFSEAQRRCSVHASAEALSPIRASSAASLLTDAVAAA
jgi:hypothetical protein